MPGGTELRIVTLVVLLGLLGAAVVALRLGRPSPPAMATGLWSHVEELRRRILIVAAVVLAGMTAALTIHFESHRGFPVPSFSIYDGLAAQLFHQMAQDLVPSGVRLVALSPMDGFVAQLNLALGIGLLLAVPVGLDQMTRFLEPALQDRERALLRRALLPAIALFILGAAFAYAAVLPITLRALYQFSDALGAQSLMSVRDLGLFALSFMAGFGLAFQTPILMVALSRTGLVARGFYWRYWRHALIVLLVVAMIVTPDPTVVSQLMLAIPLMALYCVGAWWADRVAPNDT